MYLPLPLPDANIRQVEVKVVGLPNHAPSPLNLLLDMCQSDNVGHLKSKIAEELSLKPETDKLQIAEVLGHHISRYDFQRLMGEFTLID